MFFLFIFFSPFCFFVHVLLLVHARSYAASHGVRVRFYRDPHVLSSGLPFGDVLVDLCEFYKSAHEPSADFYRNTHKDARGSEQHFINPIWASRDLQDHLQNYKCSLERLLI